MSHNHIGLVRSGLMYGLEVEENVFIRHRVGLHPPEIASVIGIYYPRHTAWTQPFAANVLVGLSLFPLPASMAFETFPENIASRLRAALMFQVAYIRVTGDVAVTASGGIAGLAAGLSAFLTCINAAVFLTVIVTLEAPVAEMAESQKSFWVYNGVNMTGTSPTLGWHQLNVIPGLVLYSTLVLWWIDDCVTLSSTKNYYTASITLSNAGTSSRPHGLFVGIPTSCCSASAPRLCNGLLLCCICL